MNQKLLRQIPKVDELMKQPRLQQLYYACCYKKESGRALTPFGWNVAYLLCRVFSMPRYSSTSCSAVPGT